MQDRWRGWESRDTAKAFADYAAYVARSSATELAFFTINEFTTFVEWGHGTGLLAPGLKLPAARLRNQVRHHAVLAHGLAVQAIRAKALSGTKVGLVENIVAGVPMPSCLRRRRSPKFTPEDLKIISSPSDFVGINVYVPKYVRAINAAPKYKILNSRRKRPSTSMARNTVSAFLLRARLPS